MPGPTALRTETDPFVILGKADVADFQFDGFVAHIHIGFTFVDQVGYRLAILVVASGYITGHRVVITAEQFVDGHAGGLALDVPQCDVNGGHGGEDLRPSET